MLNQTLKIKNSIVVRLIDLLINLKNTNKKMLNTHIVKELNTTPTIMTNTKQILQNNGCIETYYHEDPKQQIKTKFHKRKLIRITPRGEKFFYHIKEVEKIWYNVVNNEEGKNGN